MHGGEHSEPRWYDKSISLLVTPDGQASTNFEHSPFDGSTIIRMQNDVWHMAAGLDSGKAVPTDAVHLEEEVLACEAVTLSLSAELQQYVAEAVEAFAKFRSVTSTKAFHFDRFGEQEVKSSWGRDFNPDGILHMAFQLTYYRLHGPAGHKSRYEDPAIETLSEIASEAGHDTATYVFTNVDMFADAKRFKRALKDLAE